MDNQNEIRATLSELTDLIGDYNDDGKVDLNDILKVIDDVERAKSTLVKVEIILIELLREKIYNRNENVARDPVKVDPELDDAGQKPTA